MELPGSADDTERGRIRATKRIGKCIVICIRCGDCPANILSRCRVLCDGARGAIAICEHGCAVLVDICYIDRDKDCICEPAAIRNADGETVVSVLRFIVEGGSGLHLPCIRVNLKRVPIAPTQRIGQCIAAIWVCGSEGGPDVYACSGVLCDSARRAGTLGDHRCLVYVDDINCNINGVAAIVAIRDRDGHRIR